MRRTKIVATLGPATSTPERLADLINAGMNVARFNFSHGNHAQHAARMVTLRAVAAELGRPVAVMQDLQGPKIRTGALVGGKPVSLVAGQMFTITTENILGDSKRVSTTYEALPKDVKPGNRILLSDGTIELRVISTTDTEVICQALNSATLREHQGINLPGVTISAPTVTQKDMDDLRFGLEQNVDYIALSFVRRAEDIKQVKEVIAEAGRDTPVIAKIERPEALDVLDEILAVADGVMVARGDLGVEIPLRQVPIIQKEIIAAANAHTVPVITATQMLESMIDEPHPTRAEVTDVANAIIDGSDAVMLSGETSIGKYPVETVRMMAQIAETTENSAYCRTSGDAEDVYRLLHRVQTAPQAIGAAVSAIVQTLPVSAIWVFTQSGSTARQVAHYRPGVPILAFTPFEHVYRRLSLIWGVTPIKSQYIETDRDFWERIPATALEQGYARPGETVIITGGHPLNEHGPTNFLKIYEIGAA